MAGQYQLVIQKGPTPGKSFSLSKGEIFIGRDVNNEIVINDSEISRRHCRLIQQLDNYIIEDLGSTNGTFINEKKITNQHILRVGESIRIGDNVVLSYETTDDDPNATMVSGRDPGLVGTAIEPAPDLAKPAAPAPQAPPPAAPPAAQPAAPPPKIDNATPAPPAQAPLSPSPLEGLKQRLQGRWLLLGCGGLLILGGCIFIGGLYYIDANSLWCDVFGDAVCGILADIFL